MFKSIQLKNFQGHKDSIINFVPGVNTIIGKSDSGKSSVVRAILWVLTNRPLGESFRSHWAEKENTEVIIEWKNKTVRRIKGKSINSYFIDDTEYKAMGTDVPEEVQRIFFMNEINYQKQMDQPFLLSMSNSDIARLLNKIVNLDVIDNAFTGINKLINENNSTERHLQKESDKIEESLEQFVNLDKKKELIDKINSFYGEYVSKKESLCDLQDILDKIILVKTSCRDTSTWENKLKYIQKKFNSYNETKNQLGNLQDLCNRISQSQQSLRKCLDTKSLEKKIKIVRVSIQDIQNKSVSLHLLKDTVREITSIVEYLEDNKNSLMELESMYEEIVPDKCPLCGQSMKGDKEHEVKHKNKKR